MNIIQIISLSMVFLQIEIFLNYVTLCQKLLNAKNLKHQQFIEFVVVNCFIIHCDFPTSYLHIEHPEQNYMKRHKINLKPIHTLLRAADFVFYVFQSPTYGILIMVYEIMNVFNKFIHQRRYFYDGSRCPWILTCYFLYSCFDGHLWFIFLLSIFCTLIFNIINWMSQQLCIFISISANKQKHKTENKLSTQNELIKYKIIIRVKIQMSTVNRLKHKKKHTDQSTEQQPPNPPPVNVTPKFTTQKRTKCYKDPAHTAQKQAQYQSFYQIGQCNPNGVTTTSSLFPHSHLMHSYYNIPLGFMCSPILALQNENTEVMEKSADRIPRCQFCRAYMNCYNKIDKKKFTCFLCGRDTNLSKDYNPNQQPNQQTKSPVYQAIGPTNYYPKPPSQQTFVFILDLNSDSAQTKMLYYAVAAMKQVFSRTQLDDLCIYFFTYDELIQEYDFTGQQIKCTVIDQSIQGQLTPQFSSCYLKDIREKLFHMLDTLEDISSNNNRKGSNFTRAFDYVFNALKHTSAKFFIFQTNEAFINEQTFKQQIPKNINQNTKISLSRVQSLLQTKNKTFFDKYVNQILQNQCSFSFFIFSKNYKNLKTIHDVVKLSSSQLKVYSKDSPTELERFYYDLSYLLGATYFTNLRSQYIVSSGWNFIAIYGNFYRINQFITFQMNYIEPSRKIFALVTPSSTNQYPYPYCCIQIVTNYIYKRQSLICVSTIVQPVTGQIQRLYSSIDTYSSITALSKGFLSSLRMDNIDLARKKITDAIGLIYTCALNEFKKPENIPDSIMSIVMSGLSMLKSIHSQPELIINTPNFDKILGERNLLQFAGINDLGTHFSPYLFDLTNLSADMCRQDQQFVYPPTVQIKFNNVRNGLYLLDNGISLYLFIAKQCNGQLLRDIFGKQKLTKNDQLTQQLLTQQESFRSSQILYLIKFLREQKSYGWIPLYIIRCGQNTMNERNFYLHFYSQKYQEFRNYKFNLQQFIALITKNNVG